MMIPTSKYLSVWPLPGGTAHYVDTLISSLKFVKTSKPDRQQLIDWFVSTYGVSPGSAIGYVGNTLDRTGLLDHEKSRYRLTPAGEDFLSTQDNRALFLVLNQNIVGFNRAVEVLKSGPMTLEDFAHEVTVGLGVKWTSPHDQPNWRLQWLKSMGFVEYRNHRFQLTTTGEALVRDLSEGKTQESIPTNRPTSAPWTALTSASTELPVRANTAIAQDLEIAQHDSVNPTQFEVLVAEAFRFLGFDAEHIGGKGDTDVCLTANLGENSYSAVIETKTSGSERIPENQIDWQAIEEHKKARKATFAAVVAPGYPGGVVESRATRLGFTLMTTVDLTSLMEMHAQSPLPLDVLSSIFRTPGFLDLENNSSLDEGVAEASQHQTLVSSIVAALYVLQREHQKTFTSDINWVLDKQFEHEDIESELPVLESLGLVRKQPDGQWIALVNPTVAQSVFRALAASFEL